MPASANRVLIAANPRAGSRPGGRRIHLLKDLLLDRGFGVEVLTDLDTVAAHARQWHSAGRLRAVVAAGGDGTVAELVNRTEPGTPITVYPLGTANLIAKFLEIQADPYRFTQMIADGTVLRLDAGRAANRVFLLMCSCGFDANVVHRMHSERRGHISYFSYLQPILAALRNYGYPELRVYRLGEGESAEPLRVRWAFVVNIPRYAMGLRFTPEALGADGSLDLCVFRRGRFRHALWYLVHVMFGKQKRLIDCSESKCTRLRIESDVPVPYQMDGDPGGFLPLEVEVLPQRFSILAPEHCAEARRLRQRESSG